MFLRVSLSNNETLFNNVKATYEAALEKSGYKTKLQYQSQSQNNKKTRKRYLTWFNPPYGTNVKTKNVGQTFPQFNLQTLPRPLSIPQNRQSQ